MRPEKKSIPVIKSLIGLSISVFIISLFYIKSFKSDERIEISRKKVVTKETLKRQAIDAFIDYINDQPKVTFNRIYLSKAFLDIRNLIRKIAIAEDYEFQYADLVIVENDILKIRNEKLLGTQSRHIRNAAAILGNSLLKLQRHEYPKLKEEADRLAYATRSFVGTDLKLEQDHRIRVFLDRTIKLIEKMK